MPEEIRILEESGRPLTGLFGFSPLPASFFLLMGLIVLLYIGSAELVKRVFYDWESHVRT